MSSSVWWCLVQKCLFLFVSISGHARAHRQSLCAGVSDVWFRKGSFSSFWYNKFKFCSFPSIFGVWCPWCHIVRGVKLSVFAYGVKLSWFQIFRCQIVCGVNLSYRKGEKTSQFFHFNNNFQFWKFAKVYFCEVFLKCILGFTSLLFSVAKHVVVDIQMTPS